MILKDGDQQQVACDGCGAESPVYDEKDFHEMIDEIKAEGWSVTRPNGTWQHHCKDCANGGSALAQARKKFVLR